MNLLHIPLVIDTDPNDSDFFAIWTNEKEKINCTLAEGIGSKEDAEQKASEMDGGDFTPDSDWKDSDWHIVESLTQEL